MSGVGCLIITDGRGEYLEQMWASLMWDGPDFAHTVLVDDSGDDEYGLWAQELIGPSVFVHHSHRRGLAAAIQSGWNAMGDVDYILHLEEDFTFPDPIPLVDMMRILHLPGNDFAQVCLLRQPWSPAEIEAGGIIEMDPDGYKHLHHFGHKGFVHQKWFSFNPCLYPAWVRDYGADLEAPLTDRLVADGKRFVYYGKPGDPPRCIHIGEKRSSGWML